MAIAERELTSEIENESQDDTNVTNIEEAKTKRAKIDLDAMADTDKITFAFQVPVGLRKALNAAGESAGVSGSDYARNELARLVGYVIPEEFTERKTRDGSKYAGLTEEQKKVAQAEAAKTKRDAVAAFLKALKGNPSKAQELAAEMGVDVGALI